MYIDGIHSDQFTVAATPRRRFDISVQIQNLLNFKCMRLEIVSLAYSWRGDQIEQIQETVTWHSIPNGQMIAASLDFNSNWTPISGKERA